MVPMMLTVEIVAMMATEVMVGSDGGYEGGGGSNCDGDGGSHE